MHLFVKDRIPVPPEILGPVHGVVGIAQQIFRFVVARMPHGDSGADGGVGLRVVELERDLELLMKAFGDARRVADRLDVLRDDDEFVAAEATDRVAGPADGSDPIGNRHEQLVADEVTETVVDGLEPVDIEEEHREGLVLHSRRPGESVKSTGTGRWQRTFPITNPVKSAEETMAPRE